MDNEFEITLILHPEKHQGEGQIPISLTNAAQILRGAKTTELDDIAKALEQFVCNVCAGAKQIGNRKFITCPECNGTGWSDAAAMYSIDEVVERGDN